MTAIPEKFHQYCYGLDASPLLPSMTGAFTLPADPDSDLYSREFDPRANEIVCGGTDEGAHETIYYEPGQKFSWRYRFLDKELKRVFAFFFIHCAKATDTVILIHTTGHAKLWINRELFTVVFDTNRMLVAKLKRGINSIVIERPEAMEQDGFFIRVSKYQAEQEKCDLPCIFQGSMQNVARMGYTFHSGVYLYDNQPFIFAFYPNHDVFAKSGVLQFALTDNRTREVLFERELPIKQKHSVGFQGNGFDDYDTGHYLVAEIKYTYANGYTHVDRIALFTRPVENMLETTRQNAAAAISEAAHGYDKLCLQYGIDYITDPRRDLSAVVAQAALLRSNTALVQKGEHRDGFIYNRGMKRVFFYDPTCNSVSCYRVYIPENYSDSVQYPLIILHATVEYNQWSGVFAKYTAEPVIAVDISGRGVLLGSYIGEAAIRVVLEDVFARFSIDRNRIYCTGYSNGGGAAWAQAQAYPDLFAGIYAAAGQANLDLLCNLGNMKLMYLSSPADYMYDVYQQIDARLEGHPDRLGLLGDGFSHNMLLRLWLNEKAFDLLLKARRNEYPDHITFKTPRNRHRKAYWIEIHSIAGREIEGAIDAKIKSPHKIDVLCSGISGFSITIPPQVDRTHFEVSVNGKAAFVFENPAAERIHFTQESNVQSGAFRPIENYMPIADMHKGSGLLDVYLDPLSIVMPADGADCIKKTAAAYAEPNCNGFLSRVYVKYPIVSYEEWACTADLAERSYVIIDDGSPHPLLEQIRQNTKVAVDRAGWTYNGAAHPGKCCVQQIVGSPWNPARNIHLIRCNDPAMLQKNLFTRKLVIPTYVSGRHRFLNNDALIFDECGYHGILDYDSAPVDL